MTVSRTALAALMTLACGAATAMAQDIKVGAIYMDAQGYYAGVRKGIQDAAKETGQNPSLWRRTPRAISPRRVRSSTRWFRQA